MRGTMQMAAGIDTILERERAKRGMIYEYIYIYESYEFKMSQFVLTLK